MLTRYEPFSAMRSLQDEMNRAFGNVLTRTDDGSSAATSGWSPAVDVREDSDRFVIHADVPGVAPGDIELTMENGVLTIKGERSKDATSDANGFRRVERVYGSFYRRFTLPDTADGESVSAKTRDGVLEVVIPKKAAVQPKRIEVQS